MSGHTIRKPNGGDVRPAGGGYDTVDRLAVYVAAVVEPTLSDDEAKYLALMVKATPDIGSRLATLDSFVDALGVALERFDRGERPDLHGHVKADRPHCYCGRVG